MAAAVATRFSGSSFNIDILVGRFDLSGNPIFVQTYGDHLGGDLYLGISLVESSAKPGHFYVGYKYENGVSGKLLPGIMEIDNNLNYQWLKVYEGTGLASGTNFDFRDLEDSQNGELVMCGAFDPAAYPGVSSTSFTLAVDNSGNSLGINLHQFGGANQAHTAVLNALKYNPVTQKLNPVGGQNTSPGQPWYWSGTVNIFWALGTDTDGGTLCAVTADPATTSLFPEQIAMTTTQFTYINPVLSPVYVKEVQPFDQDQCNPAKRSLAELGTSSGEVQIGFDVLQQQIHLTWEPESNGEGMVRLLDLQGKLLQEKSVSGAEVKLQVEGYSQGVYLLQYALPGNLVGTRKIAVHQ